MVNQAVGGAPTYKESELVIGLVAPVGANLDMFENFLERNLAPMGYSLNKVRLSQLAANFRTGDEPGAGVSERSYDRLSRLMTLGNELRAASGRADFLALAAAKEINRGRGGQGNDVRPKTAHILRSLKHPDEVLALRRIYGSGFLLLGVVVDETERRKYLRDDKNCSPEEVDKLLKRDAHEEELEHGQRTRETFHLADAFIPLNESRLGRFLNLVFGYPFETPSLDEYAMFLAFASSLRSADLSRQVGAVVVSPEGDVVGVGANDVPKSRGGLHWPGDGDRRDHVKGEDFNERERNRILTEALERVRPEGVDEAEWLSRGRSLLSKSSLMDITEYGRAVHAEMEAILSCARSGVSPRGGTLFSTTFPCHNCAKHIIAAGISRVVYVEPYAKSRATDLFPDEITLNRAEGMVNFEAFVGVGPRRFLDLFSMNLSSGYKLKRKADGRKVDWVSENSFPRIPLLPNTYIDRERVAANVLIALTREAPDEENHS